jgi:hypothetical protein
VMTWPVGSNVVPPSLSKTASGPPAAHEQEVLAAKRSKNEPVSARENR